MSKFIFHCSLMYLKKYFCIDINFKVPCMYYLYLCLIDFILSLQVFVSSGYTSALITTYEHYCLLGNNTCGLCLLIMLLIIIIIVHIFIVHICVLYMLHWIIYIINIYIYIKYKENIIVVIYISLFFVAPTRGGPIAFSTAIITCRLLFVWRRKLFDLAVIDCITPEIM